MRRDSRLSGVLHILLHMADHDGPVKSEVLARAMETNPVVVRRLMAGLRDAGYVTAEKGHGGGWSISCDLKRITLADVYAAIGAPGLLAMSNRTEAPGCLVEQAVNAALSVAFEAAESALLRRFGEVSLATLRADIQSRSKTKRGPRSLEKAHV